MGGGVPVVLEPEAVEPVLMQVVSELRASWPDRVIEAEFSLPTAVNCDRGRVGQLFSNLLANALTYGKADAPIRVCARTFDGAFELSVSNAGDPISPAAQEQHFNRSFAEPSSPARAGWGWASTSLPRSPKCTVHRHPAPPWQIISGIPPSTETSGA